MPTTQEYVNLIQQFQRPQLITLWQQITARDTPGWEKGKAFEFLVLRAFELEGAVIRWPYSVKLLDEEVEQIDGAVHFKDINLSIIIECKDYILKVNIEPIAKLRNQLLRRPSTTIGSIFITGEFTRTAIILTQFLTPQTILLWERGNIEFCLRKGSFRENFLKKYHWAIETGDPNFNVILDNDL